MLAHVVLAAVLVARPEAPPEGELSRGGTDRGAMELGLASVMAATTIALVAFGAIELSRGLSQREACGGISTIDCDAVDPPNFKFAAAGLSWGFSVPLIIGAGLLYARGARIHRDYRRVKARERVDLRLGGSAGRHGGRLSLVLRF